MVSKEGFCNDEKVTLKDLAKLSGFPEGLIKKELVLDEENLTLEKLRESMLNYLDETLREAH